MSTNHSATGNVRSQFKLAVDNNAAYVEQVADCKGFVGAVGAVVGAVVGAPYFLRRSRRSRFEGF